MTKETEQKVSYFGFLGITGYHSQRQAADQRRDDFLLELGYHVLRMPAELIEKQPSLAREVVRQALIATEPE